MCLQLWVVPIRERYVTNLKSLFHPGHVLRYVILGYTIWNYALMSAMHKLVLIEAVDAGCTRSRNWHGFLVLSHVGTAIVVIKCIGLCEAWQVAANLCLKDGIRLVCSRGHHFIATWIRHRLEIADPLCSWIGYYRAAFGNLTSAFVGIEVSRGALIYLVNVMRCFIALLAYTWLSVDLRQQRCLVLCLFYICLLESIIDFNNGAARVYNTEIYLAIKFEKWYDFLPRLMCVSCLAD